MTNEQKGLVSAHLIVSIIKMSYWSFIKTLFFRFLDYCLLKDEQSASESRESRSLRRHLVIRDFSKCLTEFASIVLRKYYLRMLVNSVVNLLLHLVLCYLCFTMFKWKTCQSEKLRYKTYRVIAPSAMKISSRPSNMSWLPQFRWVMVVQQRPFSQRFARRLIRLDQSLLNIITSSGALMNQIVTLP